MRQKAEGSWHGWFSSESSIPYFCTRARRSPCDGKKINHGQAGKRRVRVELEDGGLQSRGEPSPALLLLLLPVLTIQKHASIKSRSASECARCPSTGATQHAIAYERSAATATSPAAHGVQKVAYRHRPAPPAHMSMGPLAHWNCGDITIMTCVGGRGRGAPRGGERDEEIRRGGS